MKCSILSRLPFFSSRNASSTFRYVESPPPRPVKKFKNSALPNSPTVKINVNHSGKIVVGPKKAVLERNASFSKDSPRGAIKVISSNNDFYKVMQDPVADQNYIKMFNVTSKGFLQFREHFRLVLSKMGEENRFIFTGNRQSGKTLTCYLLLLDAFYSKFDGLIIPAIHLSKWFQDTAITPFVQLENETLDFLDFNVDFLRYLMLVNTLPENVDNHVLANTKLLDDERWTSQLFSFKGDSLLNVVRTGMTNPPIAQHVIRVLFNTLLEQEVPTRIIVDNANLLSEVHSSKFEGLRENLGVNEEWWNQPKLRSEHITLLQQIRKLIKFQKHGHVFLTIDPARDISDQVISDLGDHEFYHVTIPNTPNETEYLQFLNQLRHFQFLSKNLTEFEVAELTYLVGRSYPDTFKYVHFL